jgi:hypothetical protein
MSEAERKWEDEILMLAWLFIWVKYSHADAGE